jgi:hypothetical protein
MDWFDLGELAFELLFEVVIPAALELLADIGERQKRPLKPAFPWVWILFAGSVAGAASALIWPHRVFHERPLFPGLSLLLAPAFASRVMGSIGDRLRKRGITPTPLATAGGGALFAFSMALARFLMVGLK